MNKYAEARQAMFNYFIDSHGLTMIESEMDDIIELARKCIETEWIDEFEDDRMTHE